MTNASRRIKKGEFELCDKNGVKNIIEVPIGYDGLTIAHSKTGKPFKLTLAQVYLALAEKVPDKDGKRRKPLQNLVRHRCFFAGC